MSEKTIVTWSMMVLGAGQLFPWLCFITAVDYFQFVYGASIMYTFAVVNMVPCALTTIYLTFGGSSVSSSVKISGGLIGLILILATVVVLDHLLTLEVVTLRTAHSITLMSVAACAIATATLQNGIFSLASAMGSDYSIALNSGQRSAGIAVVVIRCMTKASTSGAGLLPLELSTLYYFCIAILVLSFGLVSWQRIKTSEIVRNALGEGKSQKEQPILPSAISIKAETHDQQAMLSQHRLALKVLWQSSATCLSVYITFTVTLACFPGMATSLKTYSDDPADWFPVIMVGLFNAGDFIGVQLPRYVTVKSSWTLLTLTACHALFLPLFVFGVQSTSLPAACRMNWYPSLITLLLGISNGFISCQCFIMTPRQVCKYLLDACGNMLGSSAVVLDDDTQLQQYMMQGEHKPCKTRLLSILMEEVGSEKAAAIAAEMDRLSPDALNGMPGAVVLFFLMCGLLSGSWLGMGVGALLTD